MVRSERGAGLQHGCAIFLFGPAFGAGCTGRRALDKGTNLFTFEHHIQEVSGETAALEPVLAPYIVKHRHELLEMRRALNRACLDAETFSLRIIVQ